MPQDDYGERKYKLLPMCVVISNEYSNTIHIRPMRPHTIPCHKHQKAENADIKISVESLVLMKARAPTFSSDLYIPLLSRCISSLRSDNKAKRMNVKM